MITLSAPLPNLNVRIVLPNPKLSDVQTPNLQIDRKRSMSNVLYTYGRDEGTDRLTYAIDLSRPKAEELARFVEEFIGDQWELVNHLDERWHVYLEGNPFERAETRRGVTAVNLIFEGVKQ